MQDAQWNETLINEIEPMRRAYSRLNGYLIYLLWKWNLFKFKLAIVAHSPPADADCGIFGEGFPHSAEKMMIIEWIMAYFVGGSRRSMWDCRMLGWLRASRREDE